MNNTELLKSILKKVKDTNRYEIGEPPSPLTEQDELVATYILDHKLIEEFDMLSGEWVYITGLNANTPLTLGLAHRLSTQGKEMLQKLS